MSSIRKDKEKKPLTAEQLNQVPDCPLCLLGTKARHEKAYYCPYCIYCVKHRKFEFSKPGGHYVFEHVFNEFLKKAYLPNVGVRKAKISEYPNIQQLEDFEKFYSKIYKFCYARRYTREEFNWLILEGNKKIAFQSIGEDLFHPLSVQMREKRKQTQNKFKKKK